MSALLRTLTVALSLALATSPVAAQDTGRAELIFLDVGQGDAIVVRSPEGKAALIDAGPGSIVPFLRGLGVDTMDLAIATHPHADHIGGMEEVLRSFPVRFFMDNGVPHTTGTYRSLMWRVEHSGVTYLEAKARTIMLGSMTLRILPPPATAGNLNDGSVGVVVEFGDFKAILTGDSERPELEYFISRGVPDVTVLKAAHHGSSNGVSREWLAATKPEVVVISCGAGNPYGHPHTDALSLYHATATVYRTDRAGTITILAARDGALEVVTERAVSDQTGGRPAPPTPAPPPVPPVSLIGVELSVYADAPGNDHYNLNGEYAILRNTTSRTVDMARWVLCDLARHCYVFPDAAAIDPGDSVIVYTGPGQDDGRRFYMRFRQAIWNNDGDVAVLTDRAGRMVARYAY